MEEIIIKNPKVSKVFRLSEKKDCHFIIALQWYQLMEIDGELCECAMFRIDTTLGESVRFVVPKNGFWKRIGKNTLQFVLTDKSQAPIGDLRIVVNRV